MEFNTFFTRLQEAENISRIENGYSHIIYDLIYNQILDNQKYMLIDTSSYKRQGNNKPLIVDNLCAIPDFVITNHASRLKDVKRLGCIEVKFYDREVEAHLYKRRANRLINYYNTKGYLETYNHHVLYTNGWKWNYYENNEPSWSLRFSKEKCNSNSGIYDDLIKNLTKINWEYNGSK